MSFSYGNNNGFGGYGGYGNYGGYGSSPYGGYPTQPQSMQPKTNKIFVTSLEEAMARPAEPNTEIIYLHQNEPLLFEIVTDMQGRKAVKTFSLCVENKTKLQNDYVSRAEFEDFKSQVKALTVKEEKTNE